MISLLSLLTVRETLETFQSLYRKTAKIDNLVALCRLTKFQNQYNDQISGGQRQRFLLALALIKQYNPEMTIVLPKERFDLCPDNLNLPIRIVRDRIELKTEDVNSCLNRTPKLRRKRKKYREAPSLH